MPKLSSFEDCFLPIYHVGATVVLKACRMPLFLMLWIYLSFITTIAVNLMSFKGNKKGSSYSHIYEVFLDTAILLSILNQVTMTKIHGENLAVLVKYLLEPFKKYQKRTQQFTIIRQYKTRISICALAMASFIVVGNLFHGLTPLADIYWSSNQEAIEVWPLPLGKVSMKVGSVWFYTPFYVLSLSCVFVSSLMYVCWFLIMVCSTFHMMTKLKLLSLEVKSLNVKCEELCEYHLSFYNRKKRLKIPRKEIVDIYSLECLKNVIKGHTKIMG